MESTGFFVPRRSSSRSFVLVLFGTVFFYYYKCRYVVKQFLAENDLSLPSLPDVRTMNLPKVRLPPRLAGLKSVKVRNMCSLDKLSRVNWPLSNISINNKLPNFKTSALATITRVGSGVTPENGPAMSAILSILK